MRLLSVLLALSLAPVASAIDPYVPYQGRVVDSSGSPINITGVARVSLYEDSAGADLAWRKTYTDIAFHDGYFSVALEGNDDSANTLGNALSADRLWIGVAVAGGDDLLPLQRVSSVLAAGSASAVVVDPSGGILCDQAGALRFTGSAFQACDGTRWLSFGTADYPDVRLFTGAGGPQPFVVPQDVSEVQVKLWGAGGGGGDDGGWAQGYAGGSGGYVSATVTVTPGEILEVMVGEGGGPRFPFGSYPNYGGGGGASIDPSDVQYSASGGGRSAIRRGGEDLLTAGGGGGGGSRHPNGSTSGNQGGGGGGVVGEAGRQASNTPATGGTSSAGGQAGVGSANNGTAGAKYEGGRTGAHSYGGGGGGGWYGGGSGGHQSGDAMGGGGGGSSYVSGPNVADGRTIAAVGTLVPNSQDVDYFGTTAAGGQADNYGSDGLVVLRFNTEETTTPSFERETFAYTGSDQTWTVPADVDQIWLKVWGAGGGGGARGSWAKGATAGAGGYSVALVSVTPGQLLTLEVGEGGVSAPLPAPGSIYGGGGSYGTSVDNQYCGSGGGRSAVRLGASELVVAGGGGGGGAVHANSGSRVAWGGAGGGLVGEAGSQGGQGAHATGGTQSAGGGAGTGSSNNGQAGGLNQGANTGTHSYGGAGGGGYYGGGSGGHQSSQIMGGGAGGSGYIDGSAVWGLSQVGWRNVPPSAEDDDYASGIATGGAISGNGGNGRIVILY